MVSRQTLTLYQVINPQLRLAGPRRNAKVLAAA